MGKHLVIVESPAKAKTINKILGGDFVVKSSLGHVRDLPQRQLGVDVAKDFEPVYEISKGKEKTIAELRKYAREADRIFLAPDPDREGEAIAWHLRELLATKKNADRFARVQYNEITPTAVRAAFAQPGAINQPRVDAQQARRVLDRLVGYQVSPLLWRRIRPGLSAGRVQSVALRLVCERELEIRAFKSETFWLAGAQVRKTIAPLDPFHIKLIRINGEKPELKDAGRVAALRADFEGRPLAVSAITERPLARRAAPPFITSTLQQSASNVFRFSPDRTMRIAQKLYEGMDLGEGPTGLITYMRTDSVAIAADASRACLDYVREAFGPDYCPERPNVYRSRDSAQGAHEAIRPTDVRRTPESLASRLGPDELKLYRLIWQRFVASQMAPARLRVRTVQVTAPAQPGRPTTYLFQATASDVVFPGYMRVTGMDKPPRKEDEEEAQALPPLTVGEALECLEWQIEEKQTQPPPRYSEAALIKALETKGIGRPSTYASIIATLEKREYVTLEKRVMMPTELGLQVNHLLVGALTALFDVGFTADMERRLDEIEEGRVQWSAMLREFYARFKDWLHEARPPEADQDAMGRLLTEVEQVKTWNAPTKRGKRVYSDEAFVTSLREQHDRGEKKMSERQFEALLKVACRYREQLPGLVELLAGMGRSDALEKALSGPSPEIALQKLALTDGIQADERLRAFLDSLKEQAQSGRGLSPRQMVALDGIIERNRERIPDYVARAGALGLATEAPPDDPAVGPLLDLLAGVTEWRPAVKRGKRTFDDKEFVDSLTRQFRERGRLTPRQAAALRKLTPKYSAQIKDYDRAADQYGLRKAKRADDAADGASAEDGAPVAEA